MNATETVHSTTEPAFAVDQQGHILAWNPAAEQLFGYSGSEVVGRHCWEVLRGRDLFGNDYCAQDCQLRSMAWQRRSVHPCEMLFRDALGQPVEVRVSLFVLPGDSPADLALVHLLGPTVSEVGDMQPSDWPVSQTSGPGRLTKRELEVLQQLSQGMGTREIAQTMGLSTATIRNHIQHTLQKLRVHSRLEAVIRAQRLGLIR